jgi:DNA-binding NarL/FixJ family response regulator
MNEPPTHVVVVDDHRLFGAALKTALLAEGFAVTAPEVTDLRALGGAVMDASPDVILLDLDLGGIGSGESVLPTFVRSGAAVLIVSGTTDEAMIRRCLDHGAVGWMSKCAPLDELLASVRRVVAGRTAPPAAQCPGREGVRPRRASATASSSFDWLTARESAVLAMLMEGASVARISAACYVSVPTVRTQVRAILQKLGVHSQLEAVALASRAGWSLSSAAAAQNARRYRSSRPRDARSGSVRRVGSGPIEVSS